MEAGNRGQEEEDKYRRGNKGDRSQDERRDGNRNGSTVTVEITLKKSLVLKQLHFSQTNIAPKGSAGESAVVTKLS